MIVQIPTDVSGVSLAQVQFNGTLYPNGSTLPALNSRVNYTFTAVNIRPGYDFDHWAVTDGTIGSVTTTKSSVSFSCAQLPCPVVNLSLSLIARDHSLLSGEVYEANQAYSINASFTVPTGPWWSTPNNITFPPPGKTEVVNWGVGLGGILKGSFYGVGLQIVNASRGGGTFNHTLYKPFWSTATKGVSNQTNFPLNGITIAAGDGIQVGVTCLYGLILTDTTQHHSFSAGISLNCGGRFSAQTGQWMVWDPQNSSGVLAPNYAHGGVTKLFFNGLNVYPGAPSPCSPLIFPRPCIPSNPPHVSFSQWANAGSGWNESLNAGFVSYAVPPPPNLAAPYFVPYVSTLANVQLIIFPWNPFAGLLTQFYVLVAGGSYQNGSTANMAWGTLDPINISGGWQSSNSLGHFGAGFQQWGTSAGTGTIGNPTQQSTTLNVSGPGRLEALTLENGPSWGGYALAVNSTSTKSVETMFRIPGVNYNYTFHPSQSLNEPLGIAVGLGGYVDRVLDEVGIGLVCCNQGTTAYTLWFLSQNNSSVLLKVPTWPFAMAPGNRILLSVTSSSSTCSGVCWTVADLDQNSNPNQGNPSTFENWTASLNCTPSGSGGGATPFLNPRGASPPPPPPAYCVQPHTVEWIADNLTPSAGPYSGPMPTFSSFNFSLLEVNWQQVYLFGPFQALEGAYPDAPGIVQKLLPQVVVAVGARQFALSEG